MPTQEASGFATGVIISTHFNNPLPSRGIGDDKAEAQRLQLAARGLIANSYKPNNGSYFQKSMQLLEIFLVVGMAYRVARIVWVKDICPNDQISCTQYALPTTQYV